MASAVAGVMPTHGRHQAVELVGPAGAGKSTVVRLLRRRDAVVPPLVSAWDLSSKLLAVHGLKALPTLARAARAPYALHVGCVTDLARVIALCARLRQPDLQSHGVVLIDEGPVFLLTRVLAHEAEALRSPVLQERWRDALRECAHAVDHVIWIDAPDDVLAQRIRVRAKPHQVKEASDAEIAQFSASFRTAFAEVAARLTEQGGPGVTRLTTLDPVPRVAERVAHVLRCADAN